MRGLESLGLFIYKTATAQDQNDVFEALSAKIQHSKHVAETYRQTGLAAAMFEWTDVWKLDTENNAVSNGLKTSWLKCSVLPYAFAVRRMLSSDVQ